MRPLPPPQRDGKKLSIVVAAIAREMAAFLWAIGREVAPI
jgi:transposase